MNCLLYFFGVVAICSTFVHGHDGPHDDGSIHGCWDTCTFELCTDVTFSLSSPPDRAVSPPICTNETRTGKVHVSEAISPTGPNSYMKLSDFNPSFLDQPYSPTLFKTYPARGGGTAIGHEVLHGNQATLLEGVCIVLPVKDYQLVKKVNGREVVVKNGVGKKKLVDCLSFNIQSS